MNTEQAAAFALYIAVVLTFTAVVLMALSYYVFKRERTNRKVIDRLDAAISPFAAAASIRPWVSSGYKFRPTNVGAYECRPAWFNGEPFVAWFDGVKFCDFHSRQHLFAQDYEWRKLVKINEQA